METLDSRLRSFLLDADTEDTKPKYVSKVVRPNDAEDILSDVEEELVDSLFSDKNVSKNAHHMSHVFEELYNEYEKDSEKKGWFGRIKSTTYLQEIVLKGIPQDFRLFQDMVKQNNVGILQGNKVVVSATYHFSTLPSHHQSVEHYKERIEMYCREKYQEINCNLSLEEEVSAQDEQNEQDEQDEQDDDSYQGTTCSGIITGQISDVLAIRNLISKEAEAIELWKSAIVFDTK